jgi:hypothetical protein
MALIEKYHLVAAEKDVAANETIKEGQIVSLNEAGEVVRQSGSFVTPYGIAADTKSTTGSSMPGIDAGWQNRATDFYDETRASQKMTVYHSGGEFGTDQFSANVVSATVGEALYANNGLLCRAEESTDSGIVAYLTKAAGLYQSGVPGVDVDVGDIALGGENDNMYVEIKLVV